MSFHDVLLEPLRLFLEYPFLQRALFVALAIAVVGALLGVTVVLRGLALIGDGLGHVSLAGVALGLVLGIAPLGMALVVSIIGAVTIQWMMAKGIVKGDTAIGILFTGGLAMAILIFSSGDGFGTQPDAYLFGNLLGVSPSEVKLVIAAAVVLFGILLALHKELFFVTYSPEAARLAGLPVGVLDTLFTVVTATTIVLAVRVVGALLVSALLVIPAAAALQSANSFRGAQARAVGFAVVGVLVGLWFATAFGYAVGASVAVAQVLLFVLAAMRARLLPVLRGRTTRA